MTGLLVAMGKSPNSDKTGDDWLCTISLKVPHSGWQLVVDSVYEGNNALLVLARVSVPFEGMFAQVITTREQKIMIEGERYPVNVVVVGKTWEWSFPESYQFVSTLTEIDEMASAIIALNNQRQFRIITE